MESLSNKGKRCFIHESRLFCWRHHAKCTRVWLWYTFAFVLSRRCVREQGAFDMMSSEKASGHIWRQTASHLICEKKMLLQFLRWLWTSFCSHSLRRKKIWRYSPTRKHSKWLGGPVCSCDYHDVTSLTVPTNSSYRLTFSKITDGISCCLKAGVLRSGVCGSYYHRVIVKTLR